MDLQNERGRFDMPHLSACITRLTALTDDRSKKKGAVAKLYLENFKSYNDSFGYAFGGLLINEITAYLDAIEGIDVFHIRGVEFIIVMEISSRQEIKAILDNIMQRFENTWHIMDIHCMCSINAGVAYFPGHAATPNEILEQLGQAISESSQSGQNHLVIYNDELKYKYHRKNIIAQQIPLAIKTGAIEMRFRPTFQASTKRFTRMDCYMRMYCEGLGVIKESEFIPIAEQSGQIYSVSRFAISKACELISKLIAANKDFETVSVMISPLQFLQERFVSDVAEEIEKAGIPANRLAFEVNESVALSAFSRAHMCMSELSDMGIEHILTDFGTGYSGIYNILSMSVDVVKIKRLLTWQLDNTSNGASLVEGLIHLAKNLGLKLIAEGVETETQVKMLEEFGCDYQQGFFYSRILPAEELIEILHDRD